MNCNNIIAVGLSSNKNLMFFSNFKQKKEICFKYAKNKALFVEVLVLFFGNLYNKTLIQIISKFFNNRLTYLPPKICPSLLQIQAKLRLNVRMQ